MKKPLSPRSAKAKQERQRAEHLAFVEALEKENAQRRAANEEQRTFILAFDSWNIIWQVPTTICIQKTKLCENFHENRNI